MLARIIIIIIIGLTSVFHSYMDYGLDGLLWIRLPKISAFRNFLQIFHSSIFPFKAFIKPFEAPQRSVKIKFKLIFSLHLASRREGLTLRVNRGRKEKIKLNFYFHTSLWCLKSLINPSETPQRNVKINI